MDSKKRPGGGSFYNLLNKDIKELNGIILSLFCIVILLIAGIFSYKITNSYALFSDSLESEKLIEVTADYPSFDTSGANEPVLSENMIPVYYDESCDNNQGCWRKAYEPNTRKSHKWYNYDEKMWANSVTVSETNRDTYKTAKPGVKISMDDILTMQVWIPRYKYKVWNYNSNMTTTSSPQAITISFEKGIESTGEIKCTDNPVGTSDGTISGSLSYVSEICKVNNVECTDSLCNGKTYTHPAFTFGDKELTGIWVGKFEVSSDVNCTVSNTAVIDTYCNLSTIRPLIKPNVSTWRGAMISVYENNMMAMNDGNNKYGFLATDDTHMIKNIEWGAVAYLSHSKYGINKEVLLNSYNGFITGCGPQSEGSTSSGAICNAYDTSLGQSASTTGNVYGIYDMSGGTVEYVMANIVSYDGKEIISGISSSRNSGYDGVIYDEGNYTPYNGTYSLPSDKYIDKYSFNNGNIRSSSKLGDAIKETLGTNNREWYNDYFTTVYSQYPWFSRGGYITNDTVAGLFFIEGSRGIPYASYTSRLVISQ